MATWLPRDRGTYLNFPVDIRQQPIPSRPPYPVTSLQRISFFPRRPIDLITGGNVCFRFLHILRA